MDVPRDRDGTQLPRDLRSTRAPLRVPGAALPGCRRAGSRASRRHDVARRQLDRDRRAATARRPRSGASSSASEAGCTPSRCRSTTRRRRWRVSHPSAWRSAPASVTRSCSPGRARRPGSSSSGRRTYRTTTRVGAPRSRRSCARPWSWCSRWPLSVRSPPTPSPMRAASARSSTPSSRSSIRPHPPTSPTPPSTSPTACSRSIRSRQPQQSDAIWGTVHTRPRCLALGLTVADLATAEAALGAEGVEVRRRTTDGALVLDTAQLPFPVVLTDRLLSGDPRPAR